MTSTTTHPMAAQMAALADRCGWAVVAVGTGCCDHPGCDGGGRDDPFAYTVGLHALRLPDLIVRGLDAPTAQALLNAAARLLVDGRDISPEHHLDVDGSTWTVTTADHRDRSDMRYARAFARGSGRRLTTPWRLLEVAR